MRPLRFMVIGLGGYAAVHLEAVRWLQAQDMAELTGVVALAEDRQRFPDQVARLQGANVAMYDHIEDFFMRGVESADILTVPIGIHQHVPVSVRAMQAGLHVYCEKPAAATVQEVDHLIAAQQQTGKKVAIGFQHIYSRSIQELKARICDGRLGRVRSISLMCGWPRSRQYYSRNEWAGQLQRGDHWVLDTPANNAHSHYLLNMLYLCAAELHTAAQPAGVRAELYRAARIASADTVQLDFRVDDDTVGHAFLTHANSREHGPRMSLLCEHGTVTWKNDIGKTNVRYDSGESEKFDNDVHPQWRYDGFKNLVLAIQRNVAPLCPPQVARAQTLLINGMHESRPIVHEIPEAFVEEVEDWEMFPPNTRGIFRRVKGLDRFMKIAYDKKLFLSEQDVAWASADPPKWIELEGYRSFPQSQAFQQS